MKKINELLLLAKKASFEGMRVLEQNLNKSHKYSFDPKIKKEIKSPLDKIIERKIVKIISKSKINILTEEAGEIKNKNRIENLQWIIDPLDGTVNFIRKISECSISIALYDGQKPIFGVVASYPSKHIYWGGKNIGAYCDNVKIRVSKISKKKNAVLCSGFPSRFSFKHYNQNKILKEYMKYAKVRMLGAASISILMVAHGKADAYFENDIMIWDVAAAAAIVLGAGGMVKFNIKGKKKNTLNFFASNKFIKL